MIKARRSRFALLPLFIAICCATAFVTLLETAESLILTQVHFVALGADEYWAAGALKRIYLPAVGN